MFLMDIFHLNMNLGLTIPENCGISTITMKMNTCPRAFTDIFSKTSRWGAIFKKTTRRSILSQKI